MAGLLGHAELNVLAGGLPPQKDRQRDAVLHTRTQPRPMCLGAMVVARLGRLRFPAEDPTWVGIEHRAEP